MRGLVSFQRSSEDCGGVHCSLVCESSLGFFPFFPLLCERWMLVCWPWCSCEFVVCSEFRVRAAGALVVALESRGLRVDKVVLVRRSFELRAVPVGLPTASVCLLSVRPCGFNSSRGLSGMLRV